MTKARLTQLRTLTSWTGVMVTFSGIAFGVSTGGSPVAAAISLVGLLITCCGHWISAALDRHKAAERIQDMEMIADLRQRIESTESIIGDDAGSLRRVIQTQREAEFIRGFNGDDWK